MKKLAVILLCVVMLSSVLSGCNKGFDVSVYDSVLTEVKDTLFLSEELMAPEGMDGIRELGAIYKEEALEMLGYRYQDLNGDNAPELVIGVSPENGGYLRNQIYLVYSVINETPEQILFSTARSSYSMLTDGTFAYFGSAGAIYSICGEFTLTQENVLDCTEYYFTHEIDNDFENIGVYHNSTGNFDVVSSNLTDMTLDDFNDISEELALRILPLEEMTPFSQLP